MSLLKIVDDYKLRYGGYTFWCPYWTNEPGTPKGIFAGKGTPKKIQNKLYSLAQQYNDELKDAEQIRFLMLRNGLGVDCSGFAFYVLNKYLAETHNAKLEDHLIVEKAEIAEAISHKKSWQKVSLNEVAKLPLLSEVARKFSKNPMKITNVARLCHPKTSIDVDARDLRPGDLVRARGNKLDHVFVVVDVTGSGIKMADSRFDPVGPGGICITRSPKESLKLPLKYKITAIRRLMILADASI
jgi:hypothetical protein